MRRNISANIVSIGSMRIAEVREEAMAAAAAAAAGEGSIEKSSGCRADGPYRLFLRTMIARGANRLLL